MRVSYIDDLKQIIADKYEPATITDHDFSNSTAEVLENLISLFPFPAIDQHDVYEALIQLGYKPQDLEPLKFKWYFKIK